jgi:predicted AAA+ superfamily ATPase
VYFYDIGDVEGGEGARFENLVACALLKRCHFLEDYEGFKMHLHYVRDKDGREVDFAVLKDKKLSLLMEAKWSDSVPSSSLRYFSERLKPQQTPCQIVGKNVPEVTLKGIKVVSASTLLQNIPL